MLSVVTLSHRWKTYASGNNKTAYHLQFAGWVCDTSMQSLLDIINNHLDEKSQIELEQHLVEWLKKQNQHFSFILQYKHQVFMAVDKVSFYPLFIKQSGDSITISDDTSIWIDQGMNDDINQEMCKIYQMTGYTIGRNTLRRSVCKVLPGEMVYITKCNENVKKYNVDRVRYFIFYPNFSGHEDKDLLINKLDGCLNESCKNTIAKANGRTIQLALSAGFDSRVLLGKFLELGYDNIETFSYGTQGNFEAKFAKDLAEYVGVKWQFVDSNCDELIYKSFYNGKLADYFYKYSGITTTAALTEIVALDKLVQDYPESRNHLFVNGQTGDFVTGGHIPVTEEYEQVLSKIFNKHFGLVPSESQQYSLDMISDVLKIWAEDNLPKEIVKDMNWYGFAQVFEWQERQANFIVQQQRAYDFLHIDWSVPLWDGCLLDFYLNVPIQWQWQQKLYVQYLKEWNYKGLFLKMRPLPEMWLRYSYLIVLTGKLLKILKGQQAQNLYYKKLQYSYSTARHLYAFFDKEEYIKNCMHVRNPMTLFNQHHYKKLKTMCPQIPNSFL